MKRLQDKIEHLNTKESKDKEIIKDLEKVKMKNEQCFISKVAEIKLEKIWSNWKVRDEIWTELKQVNEVCRGIEEEHLYKSEEENFKLGEILEVSDQTIKEHKDDNIDLRKIVESNQENQKNP